MGKVLIIFEFLDQENAEHSCANNVSKDDIRQLTTREYALAVAAEIEALKKNGGVYITEIKYSKEAIAYALDKNMINGDNEEWNIKTGIKLYMKFTGMLHPVALRLYDKYDFKFDSETLNWLAQIRSSEDDVISVYNLPNDSKNGIAVRKGLR